MAEAVDECLSADAKGRVLPGCEQCEQCTLDRARVGDRVEVLEVRDDYARMQALRFGMGEGACVTCVTRIPAGPLVLRSGRQEIAVGRNLARGIRVRRRGPDAGGSQAG